MRYLYLTIFIIVTTAHLIASLKNNKYYRDITKGMILLSLLGFYLESTMVVSWFIVCALIFSWIGDLLLIPKGNKWFLIGGISFIVSHIFFIFSYNELMNITNIPLYLIIVIACIYILFVFIVFSKLTKYLKKALIFPMILYLVVNATMNSFAWFRLIAGLNIGSLITAVGASLFFLSDSSLFFVRFNKDSIQKSHFLVMLTYSLGEFLIILGLIL